MKQRLRLKTKIFGIVLRCPMHPKYPHSKVGLLSAETKYNLSLSV